MPSGAHRYPRGATFIELMVVLMVLCVLAAASAPMLKGYYQRNQLRAAAREFAALARYARQTAILRNGNTEIHIDFKHDRYRLVLNPRERSDFLISRKEDLNEAERVRELGSAHQKVFFKTVESATDPFGSEQIVKIRFFKNGSASASTIVIAGADNSQMTIEIAGATGAIRTCRGAPRGTAAAGAAAAEARP